MKNTEINIDKNIERGVVQNDESPKSTRITIDREHLYKTKGKEIPTVKISFGELDENQQNSLLEFLSLYVD